MKALLTNGPMPHVSTKAEIHYVLKEQISIAILDNGGGGTSGRRPAEATVQSSREFSIGSKVHVRLNDSIKREISVTTISV